LSATNGSLTLSRLAVATDETALGLHRASKEPIMKKPVP
jgi:hypothetical protein